jgi:hypothetical protein
MKLQCSCGAKYAFDVTPEMAQNPVGFVCPNCGLDSSDFVNELVRRELAKQFPDSTPAAPAGPPPPQPEAPAAPAASQLKILRGEATAPAPAEAAPVSAICPKHRGMSATEKCAVCHKPICPKCMELFGYFCSIFCKNKAEAAKMNVPVYAGQKFLAERKFWRRTGLLSGAIGLVLFAASGFWFWYAWIGSVPHAVLSVHFDGISHSGNARLVGGDQVVFLHGGTLARYDLKTGEKVWSLELVTKQQVTDALKQQDEEAAEERQKYGHGPAPMIEPLREKYARIDLEEELSLFDSGKNIWVARENTLTHYDWNSGDILQQLTLTNNFGEFTERGDELLTFARAENGGQVVTHVNLNTGDLRTEEFGGAGGVMMAQNSARPEGGGLPLSPNAGGEPLNPQKVAQQAQNLTLPARIALPALLANAQHNQQINAELDSDQGQYRGSSNARPAAPQRLEQFENFHLVPDGNGFVEFGVRLVQQHFVAREAMKAPPKKSALDGNIGVMNETAAVNEQLNEIQRDNGGDKVVEDQSVYDVSLRRPGSSQIAWTGEVIGTPQLFPLKTVNVLAAGKTIIVFDKSNKKLWQASLTYYVTGGDRQLFQSQFGQGPCAENGDTLYVFDQAVLTAYDPATGDARWRIPSVGVVGLFFDDDGMVYVNTTTGNPDDIKYARQIDMTKQTQAVVLKIDPKDGDILWRAKPGGFISYLSGKFIYTEQSFDPGDQEDVLNESLAGLQKPPFFRIKRINPQNGHEMWDYEEGRAPVVIHFDRNFIEVVLKKEVEVLRFFSF